jgi:pentatricopeptide repeat protein
MPAQLDGHAHAGAGRHRRRAPRACRVHLQAAPARCGSGSGAARAGPFGALACRPKAPRASITTTAQPHDRPSPPSPPPTPRPHQAAVHAVQGGPLGQGAGGALAGATRSAAGPHFKPWRLSPHPPQNPPSHPNTPTPPKVYESLDAVGVRPDTTITNAAISACDKGGQWEAALALFRRMSDMGMARCGRAGARARGPAAAHHPRASAQSAVARV